MLKFDKTTPVLFLVFNRPETTAVVFEEIRKAQPLYLYVAADGARSPEEQLKVEQVRDIVQKVDWDCEVKTLFRAQNLGCRKAVSTAIDWFFSHVEEGIILEDDCLPSESFFAFCSHLLAEYRNDDRIGHIGGSNFQMGKTIGDGSYYFSRLTHVWGWASWRRVWNTYDVDMKSFEQFTVNHLENLASHAAYRNIWYRNLSATFHQNINTWDYQYAYCNLINNRLSIIPNSNMIKNIGFGEDATHTFGDHPHANLPTHEITEIIAPSFFIPDAQADLFTQSVEHPIVPERRKGLLSRTWKSVKQKLKDKGN